MVVLDSNPFSDQLTVIQKLAEGEGFEPIVIDWGQRVENQNHLLAFFACDRA